MSALRTLRQFSLSSSRALSTRSTLRTVARTRLVTPAVQVTRAFSVSPRAFGQGTSDSALSAKLKEELTYEVEGVSPKDVPDFIKEFKSKGIWKIEDQKFTEDVVLTRTFGNETLRATFSVADLRNDPEQDYEDEEGQHEENEQTPEQDDTMISYPIRVELTISKACHKGAVVFDLQCQDGTFIVENLTYLSDSKLVTEKDLESGLARNAAFNGPQFDVLDERGFNESLANFIPDYAEFKEQEEYTRWLKASKISLMRKRYESFVVGLPKDVMTRGRSEAQSSETNNVKLLI
ncbi:mitochondrial glycoprotein [Hymenopellis radicata]|nr:mitochondrial glycoprotein [Hymenopellis radicata]